MADLPVVYSRPALRCYEPRVDPRRFPCGERASWMRRTETGELVGYFCDQHRANGDAPIPRAVVFMEIALDVAVLVAGVASGDALARAEAVTRIETAVQLAGGTVSIRRVLSRRVRQAPPAPRRADKTFLGD